MEDRGSARGRSEWIEFWAPQHDEFIAIAVKVGTCPYNETAAANARRRLRKRLGLSATEKVHVVPHDWTKGVIGF